MSIGAELNYDPAGYTAGPVQIGAGPFLLTQIGGHNPTVTDAFLLLFLVTPGPGELPFQSFNVPAGASFSWEPSRGGRKVAELHFAVSSTGNLYTAAALDFWVYAEGFDQVP